MFDVGCNVWMLGCWKDLQIDMIVELYRYIVPAVVHVRASDLSLDLCVPHSSTLLVGQQDEINQEDDFLEQKTLDHRHDK